MNQTRNIFVSIFADVFTILFLALAFTSCQKDNLPLRGNAKKPLIGQITIPENYQYGGPEYVYNSAYSTIQRLNSWIGDENVYELAQITDVHSGGNNNYQHIGYLDKLNDLFNFNIMVNGGDIGLDTPVTPPHSESERKLILDTHNEMSIYNPWICCKGNHERNLSNETFGSIFNKCRSISLKNNIVFGSSDGCYGCYGCIDDTTSKTRLIFLNTTDAPIGEHYGMTRAQLEWLATTLSGTEGGWKIVITSHYMPHRIGAWTSDGNIFFELPCFKALREILQSFANKRKGTYPDMQLSWDYSHNDAKLVCMLSGGSHFDIHTKEDGVNYIVTQGYGYSSPQEFYDSRASFTWFNPAIDCLFSVLAVKNDGTAKLFYIGSTAESREFQIEY